MILYEAKLSALSFFSPLILGVLYSFPYIQLDAVGLYIDTTRIIWWLSVSYIALIFITIGVFFTGYAYQVAIRAAFLGAVFTTGILVVQYLPNTCTPFGWYLCAMAFFHYSEVLTIAVTNPRTLSLDSFILNHSNAYHIAAVTSWIEFFVELYFFPEWKETRPVSYVGLCLCCGGEFLRKLAMLTAHKNFNHVVQSVKQEDHQLITHGVYSLCRHPSYVGWFYWSMGTQLILVNPFCFVAYIAASWKFFNDRITVEELTLLNFFGEQYIEYQGKVPTGLPLIKGYRLEE